MTSPYQTPEASREPTSLAQGQGRLDIGRALSEGWALTKEHFWTALGVGVAFYFLVGLSIVLLVLPSLIVGPTLAWGVTRYGLDAYDGRGEFSTLFDGFSRIGDALKGLFLLGLISFAVAVPGEALQLVGEQADAPVIGLLGSLISIAVGLVSLRWVLGAFFAVEHNLNGYDALVASWRATSGQWLTIFLFALATFAVALLGLLCFVVGIIPASIVIFFAYVSAYRQIAGGPAQPPTPSY
ncbi:MAG: hypothetical protein AAFU79_23290 [Myxococcota bacterium]